MGLDRECWGIMGGEAVGGREERAVLGERQLSGRCRSVAGGRTVVGKLEYGGKGIGGMRKEIGRPSGEEGERREAGKMAAKVEKQAPRRDRRGAGSRACHHLKA